jgi:hypothetical protein
MIALRTRIWLFFKSVWHGVLGIITELLLVACVIATGFVVCIIWWGIFN